MNLREDQSITEDGRDEESSEIWVYDENSSARRLRSSDSLALVFAHKHNETHQMKGICVRAGERWNRDKSVNKEVRGRC